MLSEKDHISYLSQALQLARKSPALATNFRVGAIIVSNPTPENSSPTVLATGYTLELAGNTHAEQCALAKLASKFEVPEDELSTVLDSNLNAVLYTTLEPCAKRLSGNIPCVDRILATRGSSLDSSKGIRKVIFGAKEPNTFVQNSQSCRKMTDAGLSWEYIPSMEEEILLVAKEGHNQSPNETNVDDISSAERKRQEGLPRNPKKRMMEAPPG